TGCVSTISFITLVLIVSIYSDVIDLPAKIIISIIAVGIFSVDMYSTMENERTIGYYKCPNCGQKKYCKKVMSKNE
ncbi:MAG: hypothetical protein R3Y21_02185, partial [Mycoplasmatota bacterium]